MSSPTTPILRSAKPSLLKSPAANDAPKKSPASAMPATPAAPCQNCWLPVLVRPLAEPCSTFTDPASAIAPMSSPTTPTARSAKLLALKSPEASQNPNRSPASVVPDTPPPPAPCQNCWLPAPVRPLAEPYSTLTNPASATAPISSNGTPTAASMKPSLLKSACRLPAARPAVLPCAGLITAGPTIGTSARARMIDRRRICTAFPPSGSPPLRPACRYAARHRGRRDRGLSRRSSRRFQASRYVTLLDAFAHPVPLMLL